jgi:hypothetical protein
MKKLNFLKAIVDFVWIMALISIPFLVFFIGYLLVSKETFDIPIKMNGIEITILDLNAKLALFIATASYIVIIYSLFLFRKLLHLFQLKIIFDETTIFYLNRIGGLFIISGLLSGIPAFFFKLAEREIKIEIGSDSLLYLISLGLFFMVLSEVFKIAKTMKEENELTV